MASHKLDESVRQLTLFQGGPNDEWSFDSTVFIKFEGSVALYGKTKERRKSTDSDYVTLAPIPPLEIYPPASSQVTQVSPQLLSQPDQYHIKRPMIENYVFCEGTEEIAIAFLEEIMLYERLRLMSQKNLPKYYGVIVQSGLIVGIVFERYEVTLNQKRLSMTKEEGEKCMEAVKAAAKHIHSLGIAHNDINPNNIMFAKDGNVILIDFGSSRPLGQKLKSGATPGWEEGTDSFSSCENDEQAIEQLQLFIDGRRGMNP